jgi:hypothetical protein
MVIKQILRCKRKAKIPLLIIVIINRCRIRNQTLWKKVKLKGKFEAVNSCRHIQNIRAKKDKDGAKERRASC